MNAAICLTLYGVVLAWLSPALLDRLTRDGTSPRLSVALWLSAIAVAAVAWVGAGAGLIVNFVATHRGSEPVRYCLDVLLAVHRFGWVGDLMLIAVAVAGVAASAVLVRRVLQTLRRLSARSCEHAHAAHLLGTGARSNGVVVLPSEQRAAYCVAGRPSAIVVTSGAVSSLGADELAAVLAHERAHLRARHPQLLMVLKSLATTMPGLPLVRRGADAVARLVEMCADDVAARRYGPDAVLRSLAALAGQPRAVGTLGAADTAVLARVMRLANPVDAGTSRCHGAVVAATIVALVLAPPVVLVAGHL
ncbi:MAG: M56 family metallopeptidase [Mycobacterium sp.]